MSVSREYIWYATLIIQTLLLWYIFEAGTVSELLLFNTNSVILHAISWGEQVNFLWDDDEVRFVLDQHAELDFYSANSPKQYADRHIAPLVHIILIPSQPVFALSQLTHCTCFKDVS
jgi:hypothetical protein